MMLKFLPLTALALGLSSGVALADRHGGDHRGVTSEHRGGATYDHRAPVVRDHRGDNRVVVRDRGWHGGGRVYVNEGARYRHFDRRPIYVSRPVIRERYYNYYRRPTLIVESYGPRPGYFWVAGNWYWSGAEWTWQSGHYQPDPNYVESGYYDSY
jgi:hypothetical protein